MKTNIAVFFGCRSVEHEVSIISAVQAMHSINRNKYDVTPIYVSKDGTMYSGDALFEIDNYKNLDALFKSAYKINLLRDNGKVYVQRLDTKRFKIAKATVIDVAFPIVHGTNCEDGTLAGYLEYLGLPYVGCDIISASVGMDKAIFKDVLVAAGLPCVPCIRFRAREYSLNKDELLNKIETEISFPLIIKPINLGSSVGITKVDSRAELEEAISLAMSFSDKILAEKAIENLREINCSVLGDPDECCASVCEEPIMHDNILSYEDKYMGSKQSGPSKGMQSLGRKIPADISEDKAEEIKALSCKIFKALGASGVVRIDYLMNDKTGEVFANEINTIPGSLAFYLWDASGLKYTDMIDRLIEIAFRRQRNRDNLSFTIDTNILSGVSFGSKGSKGAKL